MVLFKRHYGSSIKSVGIGDSENDLKMLSAVDMPFLVQQKDKSYADRKFKKAKGVGPAGFVDVVKSIVN